jgi:hypothetical protein
MPRLAKGLVAAALLCGALAPGAAMANVTLGSSLSTATTAYEQTAGSTVYSQTALTGAQLTSPMDGTVVTWRVRGAGTNGMMNPNTLTLRIVRPSGGEIVGVASSAPQTFPTNIDDDVLRTFSTSLPIHIGDQIALSAGPNTAVPLGYYSGPTFQEFNPFADGSSSGAPTFPSLQGELQFNADIATPTGLPAPVGPTPHKKCKKGRKLKKGKCVKKKKKRKTLTRGSG